MIDRGGASRTPKKSSTRRPALASIAAAVGALVASLAFAAPASARGNDSSGPAAAAAVVAPQYERTIPSAWDADPRAGHAAMYPSGVDVDPFANVYVADTGDDQIQKYDQNGNLLWWIGTRGTKAPGRFDNPRDVAYLGGKLYVADTGNKWVQVLDAATGNPLTTWSIPGTAMGISVGFDGAGRRIILVSEAQSSTVKVYNLRGALVRSIGYGRGQGDGQMIEIRDAATDGAGNVYVADHQNNRIAKFRPDGTLVANWGGLRAGTEPGQISHPYGVDVDDKGFVYIADAGNDRIQKFDQNGKFLGKIWGGTGTFFTLRRVAVGSGSWPDVFGADLWRYRIQRFAQGGASERIFGGTPPADGHFNEPYGVAVDGWHTFVSDAVNQRIQRFDTATGEYQLKWGDRGHSEGNFGFNWPQDVTIADEGATSVVWVADTKNNRLTEFTRTGDPTGRVLGGKIGSAIGQLNWPQAIDSYCVSGQGCDLIVADTVNNRVQRWDPENQASPVVWTATGFNRPKDLTVVGDVIYVADSENHRIVRIRVANGSLIDSFGAGVLKRAEGVAVEPNGDVWVAETGMNRLAEFSNDGTLLQRFGSEGSAHGQFNNPARLEILAGASVHLFVADPWNDRVEVYKIG